MIIKNKSYAHRLQLCSSFTSDAPGNLGTNEVSRKSLKGIGISKYIFGVFTYLSYRFHTHMNNRGTMIDLTKSDI